MINLVSAGEITVGMYVIAYESEEVVNYDVWGAATRPPETKVNRNPWFKGIPYKVVGRAGPILAVDTVTQPGIVNVKISFFDTRLVNFFEVDEQYYLDYCNAHGHVPTPVKPTGTQLQFKL
jgi:hypothetical protein